MALSALSNISRLSKNKSKKQVLNTPDGKLTISPVTGWTSTTVGNEVTVQFKTTDVSYEILANQTMDISCCVVGGGGGGVAGGAGDTRLGGGGGGQVNIQTISFLNNTTHNVFVGKGGLGALNSYGISYPGNQSNLDSLVAIGGLQGTSRGGTSGNGYVGGTGGLGGGGGGAGGAGGDSGGSLIGYGGVGISFNTIFYGGGGVGGTPAQIGSENTGGGGGASSASGSAPSGGNGGSGIVILVYNLV